MCDNVIPDNVPEENILTLVQKTWAEAVVTKGPGLSQDSQKEGN